LFLWTIPLSPWKQNYYFFIFIFWQWKNFEKLSFGAFWSWSAFKLYNSLKNLWPYFLLWGDRHVGNCVNLRLPPSFRYKSLGTVPGLFPVQWWCIILFWFKWMDWVVFLGRHFKPRRLELKKQMKKIIHYIQLKPLNVLFYNAIIWLMRLNWSSHNPLPPPPLSRLEYSHKAAFSIF